MVGRPRALTGVPELLEALRIERPLSVRKMPQRQHCVGLAAAKARLEPIMGSPPLPVSRGQPVVEGVSLSLGKREILAVVGEFRPDLEQTAADELEREIARCPPGRPLHRPSPIC